MGTPPPPLVDDLIREILLRLPPDDPACLARASLACKSWRTILTGAGFLRRYREFHRTPPMLGFLRNTESRGDALYTHTARFVPTSSFRPASSDRCGMYAMDARHGRVLLYTDPYASPVSLVVWDPVTDEQWAVPPLPVATPSHVYLNAVVLCAAAGCDHLDCHGGPFTVAYVGRCYKERNTFAFIYSSEAGEWGKPAKLEGEVADAAVGNLPAAVVVGNAVYFNCIHQVTWRIVKYDMGKGELSLIDLPLMHRGLLTVTEDGKLGFAGIRSRSSLYLWSREAGPDGAMAWTQRRVIDLGSMLMYFSLGREPVWHVPYLIGFADGAGLLFVMTETGRVFSVDLQSGSYKKTSFPRFHYGDPDREPILIPYMSFYTPDCAKDLHRREEA